MAGKLSVQCTNSRVYANGVLVALVNQDRVTLKWDVHARAGARQGAMIAEACESHAAAVRVAENYARREGLIN